MFKYFGHDKVFLLDGGLAAWKAANGPVESGASKPIQAEHPYSSSVQPELLVQAEQVLEFVNKKEGVLYDARGAAGYGQGHIPSAVNLTFAKCAEEGNYTVMCHQLIRSMYVGDKIINRSSNHPRN